MKVNIKFAGDGRSLFNQEAKVVVSCEMLISRSQGYVKKFPCFIKPFFPNLCFKRQFLANVNILEDYLDNIIVGEQNISQGDVSVEDSLLCKMAETS